MKKYEDYNIVPAWRESKSNACKDNNGVGFITYGLINFIADNMTNGSTSRAGLGNREEGKYFYENEKGEVSLVPIDFYTMEKENDIADIVIVYTDGTQTDFSIECE